MCPQNFTNQTNPFKAHISPQVEKSPRSCSTAVQQALLCFDERETVFTERSAIFRYFREQIIYIIWFRQKVISTNHCDGPFGIGMGRHHNNGNALRLFLAFQFLADESPILA